MNLFFTVLGAFPLGFLVRRRAAAVLAYLIADSFLFSFQTLYLLLTWMSGGEGIGGATGFGDAPSGTFPIEYDRGEAAAYGVVNLLITLAGIALVLFGGWWRARRDSGKSLHDAAVRA